MAGVSPAFIGTKAHIGKVQGHATKENTGKKIISSYSSIEFLIMVVLILLWLYQQQVDMQVYTTFCQLMEERSLVLPFTGLA